MERLVRPAAGRAGLARGLVATTATGPLFVLAPPPRERVRTFALQLLACHVDKSVMDTAGSSSRAPGRTAQDRGKSAGAGRGATGKKTWGRWVALVGLGTILVYASSFLGSLLFYWSFQQVILAQDEDAGSRSMIWGTPTTTSECGTSTWKLRSGGDLTFRVPPGASGEVEKVGSVRRVEIDGVELMVRSFPRGFIGFLLRKEMSAVGRDTGDLDSDVEILDEVIRETPDSFDLGWSAEERQCYAARLLVKMLLFEAIPMKRSHLVTRRSPPGRAYLIEYETGESRVLTVDQSGSLLVRFGPEAPGSWCSEPGSWLR